jgi:hypothetical protein
MRDILRNARFVIPFWPSVGLLLLTTLIMGFQLMVGNNTTVRTAGASCKVGDYYTTGDSLGVRLSCTEGDVVTSTSTSNPATLVSVIQNRPDRIICDVKQNGWVSNCRAGS